MTIQDWFPLGLTDLISLQSNSQESSPAPQEHDYWYTKVVKKISLNIQKLNNSLLNFITFFSNIFCYCPVTCIFILWVYHCYPETLLRGCFWIQFSVQFSGSVVSHSLQPYRLQYARSPCPSPTPGACSNSLSQWGHPTISSSIITFSSCLQSFPASGSSQMSQFFASRGQSNGVSASASVLPMNIQGWFPLELTGLISLQSRRLSRVFSNTTVQKHQFFSAQLSL